MIFFQDYNYDKLLDRFDLKYSIYVAALDIQYSHYIPYLWTFTLDNTFDIIYGRTWNDLVLFFNQLREGLHLHDKHKLLVFLPNLSDFFHYTKKFLEFDKDPFIAKSKSEHLLISLYHCIEFRCFEQYSELNIDEQLQNAGVFVPRIDSESLSCITTTLSDDESDYSANRVLYMTNYVRRDLDTMYEGRMNRVTLTKTAQVERLIAQERERLDEGENKCNVATQVLNMNPLTSKEGRETILPLMHKAFFGGISFFEEGVIDKEYNPVYSADFISAYVARMVYSRYPIGKFRELPLPKGKKKYKKLLHGAYSKMAMMIQFVVLEMELKPGGLPFLPAMIRQMYIEDKKSEVVETRSGARIKSAKFVGFTLTDIDFKLLFENYKIKGIHITKIYGTSYGYLPNYIQKTIVRLYKDKKAAKLLYRELKKLGTLSDSDKAAYDLSKSLIARLYGVFTRSPYLKKYVFDSETKDMALIDSAYLPDHRKYSPVVYQWGVWTTALVRKEILNLRSLLLAAPGVRVLSGDTDCINFTGNAATDIIAHYNSEIKMQLEKRAAAIGCDPEDLAELGMIEVDIYKAYKLTGLKQYAYVRETDEGEKFGYKIGGMNKHCKYFDKYSSDPYKKLAHFGLGLTIPRDAEPRRFKTIINKKVHINYTDREGHLIEADVPSHPEIIIEKFYIGNLYRPGNFKEMIERGIDKDTLDTLARRTSSSLQRKSSSGNLFEGIRRKIND